MQYLSDLIFPIRILPVETVEPGDELLTETVPENRQKQIVSLPAIFWLLLLLPLRLLFCLLTHIQN